MAATEQHFGPIIFLPGENRGRYPFCHSVYIKGPGVLIDPGSDRSRLIRLREEEGVNLIWLSHWHEDHFMHLDLFPQIPIWISESDAPALNDLETFLDFYGVNGDDRAFWRPLILETFHFQPRQANKFFTDGEIIELGVDRLEVIATPGHTPGHSSFFFHKAGILYMGDYDLTKFGPWYADTCSSINDTIESLRRLRKVEARLWLTGHERGIFENNPGDIWKSYEDVIYEREGKLLDFLNEPRTLEEIVHSWIIYGKPKEPKEIFLLGERGHMLKHLERLMEKGLIRKEGDNFKRFSA